MKLKHTITEGGQELDIEELDKKQQGRVKEVQKVMGGRRLYIMESARGLIVAFDNIRSAGKAPLPGAIRFSYKDLSQLTRLKVRWLESNASQKTVSVGL